VIALVVIPSQYAYCDQPYDIMESIFLGLIMLNTAYTYGFIFLKRELLKKIEYHDESSSWISWPWVSFFSVLLTGVVTLALTLGRTPNCRNPALRAIFRVFMFICVAINSKFQFENMERKRKMFDYIFYSKAIIFNGEELKDGIILTDLSNQQFAMPIKYRFEKFKKLLPTLGWNIQINLVLDLICLTAFYITVIADHNQFRSSFSLSFAVIVLFCVDMGSSVINMVEYNKNIKYVSLKCEEHLGELEVTIFWWKPEGDLLIGYLFGLLYLGAEILFTIIL